MATTYLCPKGDQSDDLEFCSVCGIKMDGAAPVAAAATSEAHCPSCGATRVPGVRFCETCRYDFRAQTPGPPPVVTTAAVADEPSPSTTAPTAWEAVVAVDPTLDVEPDLETPCPIDAPERAFPLDLQENLVGRRSTSRGIFPQVPLSDPGVSHRHLMIYRDPAGKLLVSDLGSTNGSFLNGSDTRLEPGVKTPLSEADKVELGRWTRLTFRRRTP